MSMPDTVLKKKSTTKTIAGVESPHQLLPSWLVVSRPTGRVQNEPHIRQTSGETLLYLFRPVLRGNLDPSILGKPGNTGWC